MPDTVLGQDRNNTFQSVFSGLNLSKEDGDEAINHPKRQSNTAGESIQIHTCSHLRTCSK